MQSSVNMELHLQRKYPTRVCINLQFMSKLSVYDQALSDKNPVKFDWVRPSCEFYKTDTQIDKMICSHMKRRRLNIA